MLLTLVVANAPSATTSARAQAAAPVELFDKDIDPAILRARTSTVRIGLTFRYDAGFLRELLSATPTANELLHRNDVQVRLNDAPVANLVDDHELERTALSYVPRGQDFFDLPTVAVWHPEPTQAGIVTVCVTFRTLDRNAATGAETVHFSATEPDCFEISSTSRTFDPDPPDGTLRLTFPIAPPGPFSGPPSGGPPAGPSLTPEEQFAGGFCDAVPPFAFTTDGSAADVSSPFPVDQPGFLAHGGTTLIAPGATIPPLPPPDQGHRRNARQFEAPTIATNFNYPVITITASDDESGLGATSVTLDDDELIEFFSEGEAERELRTWSKAVALSPGPNVVELTVTDQAGNRKQVTTEVTLDREPPVFTSLDPFENEIVRVGGSSEPVQVEAHWEETGVGVDPAVAGNVRLYLAGTGANLRAIATSATIDADSAQFLVPPETLLAAAAAEGTVEVIAFVRDRVGNEACAASRFLVTEVPQRLTNMINERSRGAFEPTPVLATMEHAFQRLLAIGGNFVVAATHLPVPSVWWTSPDWLGELSGGSQLDPGAALAAFAELPRAEQIALVQSVLDKLEWVGFGSPFIAGRGAVAINELPPFPPASPLDFSSTTEHTPHQKFENYEAALLEHVRDPTFWPESTSLSLTFPPCEAHLFVMPSSPPPVLEVGVRLAGTDSELQIPEVSPESPCRLHSTGFAWFGRAALGLDVSSLQGDAFVREVDQTRAALVHRPSTNGFDLTAKQQDFENEAAYASFTSGLAAPDATEAVLAAAADAAVSVAPGSGWGPREDEELVFLGLDSALTLDGKPRSDWPYGFALWFRTNEATPSLEVETETVVTDNPALIGLEQYENTSSQGGYGVRFPDDRPSIAMELEFRTPPTAEALPSVPFTVEAGGETTLVATFNFVAPVTSPGGPVGQDGDVVDAIPDDSVVAVEIEKTVPGEAPQTIAYPDQLTKNGTVRIGLDFASAPPASNLAGTKAGTTFDVRAKLTKLRLDGQDVDLLVPVTSRFGTITIVPGAPTFLDVRTGASALVPPEDVPAPNPDETIGTPVVTMCADGTSISPYAVNMFDAFGNRVQDKSYVFSHKGEGDIYVEGDLSQSARGQVLARIRAGTSSPLDDPDADSSQYKVTVEAERVSASAPDAPSLKRKINVNLNPLAVALNEPDPAEVPIGSGQSSQLEATVSCSGAQVADGTAVTWLTSSGHIEPERPDGLGQRFDGTVVGGVTRARLHTETVNPFEQEPRRAVEKVTTAEVFLEVGAATATRTVDFVEPPGAALVLEGTPILVGDRSGTFTVERPDGSTATVAYPTSATVVVRGEPRHRVTLELEGNDVELHAFPLDTIGPGGGLEDVVDDASGTAAGGATVDRADRREGAGSVRLDGTGSVAVTVPRATSLTRDFAISFAVKSEAEGQSGILARWGGTTLALEPDGRLELRTTAGARGFAVRSAGRLEPDVWHEVEVAEISGGSALRLTFDGVPAEREAPARPATSQLVVGEGLRVKLDDLRLSDLSRPLITLGAATVRLDANGVGTVRVSATRALSGRTFALQSVMLVAHGSPEASKPLGVATGDLVEQVGKASSALLGSVEFGFEMLVSLSPVGDVRDVCKYVVALWNGDDNVSHFEGLIAIASLVGNFIPPLKAAVAPARVAKAAVKSGAKSARFAQGTGRVMKAAARSAPDFTRFSANVGESARFFGHIDAARLRQVFGSVEEGVAFLEKRKLRPRSHDSAKFADRLAANTNHVAVLKKTTDDLVATGLSADEVAEAHKVLIKTMARSKKGEAFFANLLLDEKAVAALTKITLHIKDEGGRLHRLLDRLNAMGNAADANKLLHAIDDIGTLKVTPAFGSGKVEFFHTAQFRSWVSGLYKRGRRDNPLEFADEAKGVVGEIRYFGENPSAIERLQTIREHDRKLAFDGVQKIGGNQRIVEVQALSGVPKPADFEGKLELIAKKLEETNFSFVQNGDEIRLVYFNAADMYPQSIAELAKRKARGVFKNACDTLAAAKKGASTVSLTVVAEFIEAPVKNIGEFMNAPLTTRTTVPIC